MKYERWAGILSLAAAVIHGGLTATHFEEWWGYGVFFLSVTVAQVLLGLALLMRAFEAPRDRRILALGGAIGTTLVVAMYVVSRTSGIPIFGPAAGTVEPWDVAGLVTLGLELGAIVLLARAWQALRTDAPAAKP